MPVLALLCWHACTGSLGMIHGQYARECLAHCDSKIIILYHRVTVSCAKCATYSVRYLSESGCKCDCNEAAYPGEPRMDSLMFALLCLWMACSYV